VKIDVRELATPADRAAVAKRLIHRASLVAEKVETAEIFEECRELAPKFEPQNRREP
jgi:hypothetical protein